MVPRKEDRKGAAADGSLLKNSPIHPSVCWLEAWTLEKRCRRQRSALLRFAAHTHPLCHAAALRQVRALTATCQGDQLHASSGNRHTCCQNHAALDYAHVREETASGPEVLCVRSNLSKWRTARGLRRMLTRMQPGPDLGDLLLRAQRGLLQRALADAKAWTRRELQGRDRQVSHATASPWVDGPNSVVDRTVDSSKVFLAFRSCMAPHTSAKAVRSLIWPFSRAAVTRLHRSPPAC